MENNSVKFYKDEYGALYAYAADGSHDEIIPENFILLEDEEEIEKLRNVMPAGQKSAVDKLKDFLNSNPDVSDLLNK